MPAYRTARRIVAAPLSTEGEGVLIHRAFPSRELSELDPFLLLDQFGPADLKPGQAKGFPDHPHRGFETVTYMLSGQFEHRDSFGHHGILNAGDVQWMTAGSGLVHSEVPGRSLVEKGGRLDGFQLWINLPRRDKMTAPRYQELSGARIPSAASADGLVEVKVIAGEALGMKGGVETLIPIQYLHFRLKPGASHVHEVARTLNAMLYVFAGSLTVGAAAVTPYHVAALSNDSDAVEFSTAEGAELLLIAARPIGEPIARYGPFVMNTQDELHQAFADYHAGKMGAISVPKG